MLNRFRDFWSRVSPVRDVGYKPAFRQCLEMFWLAGRFHLSPLEYYIYQLGRQGRSMKSLADYLLVNVAAKKLRPRLNPLMWEAVLTNKVLFNIYMVARGLPVAKLYGIYHPGGSGAGEETLKTEAELLEILESSQRLVLKPLGGFKGQNVLILDRDNPDSKKKLSVLAPGQGYIVEEHLTNTPQWAAYNPDSLNTLRVITFVNSRNQVRVLSAAARFGRRGKHTDNWSAGGLAAGINMDTGQLTKAVLLPQYGGGWHSCHPDSRELILGVKVPQWDDVLSLATTAAQTLPWCPAIGWDIAVTPKGPVLVEGNSQWNPALGQVSGSGLLTDDFRTDLAEMGVKLPAS